MFGEGQRTRLGGVGFQGVSCVFAPGEAKLFLLLAGEHPQACVCPSSQGNLAPLLQVLCRETLERGHPAALQFRVLFQVNTFGTTTTTKSRCSYNLNHTSLLFEKDKREDVVKWQT